MGDFGMGNLNGPIQPFQFQSYYLRESVQVSEHLQSRCPLSKRAV